jgi:hypothetical protein
MRLAAMAARQNKLQQFAGISNSFGWTNNIQL